MRARLLICLLGLMSCLAGNAQAQSGGRLEGRDGDFWTLPTTECSGDNFCEIRITPQGTIYSWDLVNQTLYISPKNEEFYATYELSTQPDGPFLFTDFVLFEDSQYVIFFSPPGGSGRLYRYALPTGTLDILELPPDTRLIECNIYTAMKQLQLRYIYQLSLGGQLMACTASPQMDPLINIIDVTTLTIQKTMDIGGAIVDVIQPYWVVAGGPNGKIVATRVPNPAAVVPNLPEIDDTAEEIVLVYDPTTEAWTYAIKPRENTFEILGVLPDGTTLFQNNTPDGEEILQFSADFQILRRFGLNAGGFLGVTADGDIFFSANFDNSDIVIANIRDFPLVEAPPTVDTANGGSTAVGERAWNIPDIACGTDCHLNARAGADGRLYIHVLDDAAHTQTLYVMERGGEQPRIYDLQQIFPRRATMRDFLPMSPEAVILFDYPMSDAPPLTLVNLNTREITPLSLGVEGHYPTPCDPFWMYRDIHLLHRMGTDQITLCSVSQGDAFVHRAHLSDGALVVDETVQAGATIPMPYSTPPWFQMTGGWMANSIS